MVELTVVGGLRSTSKTEHSAAISLKNISNEDLAGPIVVVVDGTGIATLLVHEPSGHLEDEKPYVDVLDAKGTLKPGKTLRTQKIEFRTDEALTLGVRQQFTLKTRVLYLPEEARLAQKDDDEKEENLPGKKYSQRDLDRAMAVQERWTAPFLQRGNGLVFGTAVAEDAQGNLGVKVYTQREGVADQLPDSVDGLPVMTFVIGQTFSAGPARNRMIWRNGVPIPDPIEDAKERLEGEKDAGEPTPGLNPPTQVSSPDSDQPKFAGPGGDPTIRFDRPVPIGVSIFNIEYFECSAGTLGCRCLDPLGSEFGLGNLHVIGTLIDPITPMMFGVPGDRINQNAPGEYPCCPLLCAIAFSANNTIGRLSDFEPIFLATQQIAFSGAGPTNIMDAAVFRAIPGAVHYSTPDDGYGDPKRQIGHARLGMNVQKYGRTTIYTGGGSSGIVTGVNSIAVVSYTPTLFGFFIKQIEVANLNTQIDRFTGSQTGPFGQPGDSGSMIVIKNPGQPDDRRPVGLLFAGGPTGEIDVTLANPIGAVLARFGVQVDDGSGAPSGANFSGTMGGVIGPLDPPSDF
jgi:hypothetical protein